MLLNMRCHLNYKRGELNTVHWYLRYTYLDHTSCTHLQGVGGKATSKAALLHVIFNLVVHLIHCARKIADRYNKATQIWQPSAASVTFREMQGYDQNHNRTGGCAVGNKRNKEGESRGGQGQKSMDKGSEHENKCVYGHLHMIHLCTQQSRGLSSAMTKMKT